MLTPRDFAHGFCLALNELRAGWRVAGDEVVGPEGAIVRFGSRHPSSSEGHTDVEFRFDDATSLWDCVNGFGSTPEDRVATAARVWARTTAGALLELKYSRRGEYADHYRGHEPGGFPGWHAIHSAVLGYGRGDSAERLQQWCQQQHLLAGLAGVLGDEVVQGDGPHGIKLFFGGAGIAEVRLDGDVHDAASQWLADLDWPRLEPAGFVRTFIVLVHPEVVD